MKDIEQEISQIVHVLPAEKQAKVLEFAEILKKESETTNGRKIEKELNDEEKHALRMSLVGIGNSGKGDISQRVDEILAKGINKREGWSLP